MVTVWNMSWAGPLHHSHQFWRRRTVLPSGQLDDVPGLNEAAELVPHRDGDAAALIRHFARAHLVTIFGFGYSSLWNKQREQLEITRNLNLNIQNKHRNTTSDRLVPLRRENADTSWRYGERRFTDSLTDLQHDEHDIQILRARLHIFNQKHGLGCGGSHC